MTFSFEGFIKDIRYQAFLADDLPCFEYDGFDINAAASSGKIKTSNGEFAFSKWVSPKRTRSYPFERLYNTYNSPARLTIIPVLKDEGADGDLDRIQYSTISWMNLLNIYVVLAYYHEAVKNNRPKQSKKNKITDQKFNTAIVNDQILKISQYKQTALHWNRTLIEDRFVEVYQSALNSYARIAKEAGVEVHDRHTQERYLEKVMGDFEEFKNISLQGSKGAAQREMQTTHALEHLSDGAKATFQIKNYLGGIYYLTADEVIQDDDVYIIQESKNATKGFLPSLSDIKDGLFKLILYSNLDTLCLDQKQVQFKSRLKLTSAKVVGTLSMPCNDQVVDAFLSKNKCSKKEIEIIHKLNQEATHNQKLDIVISSNGAAR